MSEFAVVGDKKVLGMFEIASQGPAAWLEHAITLRIASRRIWKELEAVIDRPHPGRLEKLAYVRGYMLLNGVAVENLLKALAVKRGLITACDGKLHIATSLSSRGGHGLTTLAETLKIDLTSDERDVLRRLEEYLSWSARYPVPKNARVYYKAHAEKMLTLLTTDAGVIEGLFNKVSVLVEATEDLNLSKGS